VTGIEDRMTTEGDVTAARCAKHACCIHVPHLEASDGNPHLTGEWHLQWMENDGAWFLVPPFGNVIEVRVGPIVDPIGELVVEGVPAFEAVRIAIERDGLFPPC
jgi:hypothetical protein